MKHFPLCFALALLMPCGFSQSLPEPVKLGNVVVQGSLRTRFEGWNWFKADADNAYLYSGNHSRFSLSQSKQKFDWMVELEAPFLLGLPDKAVAPGAQGQLGMGASYFAANDNSRNAGMVFPKQVFVRLKGLFGSDTRSLRLGRFEFLDGSEVLPKNATLAAVKRERVFQRILGPFGFTHVMRSFDGFHYADNRENINFTLIGAMPTRGVFQVDGWGPLETAFGYTSVTGQVNPSKTQNGEWRLLGIYYHDWRHVLKVDSRPLAARQGDLNNIRIYNAGGHYLHASDTGAGTFDLMLWGMFQGGRWGRIDHRAAAFDVEAGWQPKFWPKLRPWFRAALYHGTGDSDPNDTIHGSFFQMLPTPRPYARFPFFDMINNDDLSGMIKLRPHKAWTIQTEVHKLRLAHRNDLWYMGGGAFQPWTFGYQGRPSNGQRGLGTLWDVSADWTVNPHMALTLYSGYAWGSDVVERIYPKGTNGALNFLEMTFRF
jgi:hypothetical protein